jgi:hypothetical protein
MKITGPKYDLMAAAIRGFVEAFGGVANVQRSCAKMNNRQFLWWVWNYASDSLLYDDSHPLFSRSGRTRVHPHVPGFDVYADGVNDSHIETALKSIFSDVGLINRSEWLG